MKARVTPYPNTGGYRQLLYWAIGGAPRTCVAPSSTENAFDLLMQRIRDTGDGRLTASGSIQALRPVPLLPMNVSYRHRAIGWRTCLWDPYFGLAGFSPGSSDLLLPMRYYAFYRLGVLVTASPRYLSVAEKLRLDVSVGGSEGQRLSCLVNLKTIAESPDRQELPGLGWSASIPFPIPFPIPIAIRDSPGGVVRILTMFREEEAAAAEELEAACRGDVRDEDAQEFLIITPYLTGECWEGWEEEWGLKNEC